MSNVNPSGGNFGNTSGSILNALLSTAQSIAQAISQVGQNYLNVQGIQSLPAVAAKTLVKNSPGRIASISVTVAGTTAGAVIDSPLTSATAPIIYVIPTTIGMYVVNLPTAYGLVVQPGTGMVMTVSFS